MYFHTGGGEGLQSASFICLSLNKIKGQAVCLSHINWSYYCYWIQSYSKLTLWREWVSFSLPFPVSSLLLRSPVLTFQIKCSANLYSWWKVLIAWEAERRFCSQDGRRRRRRAEALNGPLFISLSLFFVGPRYHPTPSAVRKIPPRRTRQESG